MDRFKFRAWDNEKNIFEYDIENCYDDWDCQNFYDYVVKDRYTVEQCTGLKDKNGKLIYEGDIVKQYDRHNRLKRIGWIVYNELEMKFKIETNHDKWSEKTESYSFFPLKQKLEIIGNIHENADLLGEE